ncbi:MAG TPA: hypothetical protein VLE99_05165 [Candidatus Saccharimonadales bacterium]|nr:hypothetical protein [Candidatus Saccharimonadales bacterium]
MYVVDCGPAEGDQAAYRFLGEPAVVDQFKLAVLSLMFGAVACGAISEGDSLNLFDSLGDQEDSVPGRDKAAFETLMDSDAAHERFRPERVAQLYDDVRRRPGTLAAALAEVALLSTEPVHPDNVKLIDSRGLLGRITGDGFSLALDPSDRAFRDDDPETTFINNTRWLVNASISQFEYVSGSYSWSGYMRSNRTHTTLGIADGAGNFQPVVTFLDRTHPSQTWRSRGKSRDLFTLRINPAELEALAEPFPYG